jgi:quercetin dioxygenase-like cupin family protein
MSSYEVRRIDELDEIPVKRAGINWRPIRRPLGITAFGINAYVGKEGEHVVEEHDESQLGHEEVYVVIDGRARFTVGGDEFDVDPGGFVYLRDPQTTREAVALEDGTTVLAVGGKPGQHDPSAWEWFFAATPARDRGDYEEALALILDGLEHKPGHPALLYNQARYEALLGRPEDALGHLRTALESEPMLVEIAANDDDFATLRDDAEFLAITGQANAGGGGS